MFFKRVTIPMNKYCFGTSKNFNYESKTTENKGHSDWKHNPHGGRTHLYIFEEFCDLLFAHLP